ncbi:hypothetical protein E4U34_003969 [Claviceps purpurea]|nr:hypothetical protein E4U34_003969 [Claviceps purpurea]
MAANRGFLVTGHGTFPLSLVLPLSFTLAVFGDVYEVCLAPSQISNRVRKGRIAQDVASFTHQDTVYVRDKRKYRGQHLMAANGEMPKRHLIVIIVVHGYNKRTKLCNRGHRGRSPMMLAPPPGGVADDTVDVKTQEA